MPIKLRNETEIYFFRSHFTSFDNEKLNQRRCLWEFITDENFGFKLEILDINYLNVAKLYIVTNNSRSYVSSPSLNYFSDNYIAITYEGETEAFEAKISIYKLPKKFDTIECLFNINNTMFKDISCECGPKIHIIPCNKLYEFSVMKDPNYEYCANISCNFEIKLNEKCPNKYVDLNIIITNARNDYFSVKCGNDWLINMFHNSTEKFDYKLLILPNSTTILNFTPNYDNKLEWLDVAKIKMKAVAYDEPKYLPDKIIYWESLDPYKEQIYRHSVLTITLSDDLLAEKAVLELRLDSTKLKNLKCLSFYENRNLTSFKRIYTEKMLMEIGTSVTVYKHNGCIDNEPIFVIGVKKPENKCLFKNDTTINKGNKPLSMIAGPENICNFHILNFAMSTVIKNIYTNSKTENVVIYAEANIKNKELIKFNQMTFNARSYILEIPANTSILIEPTEEDPSFTKSTFSYYETPKYGALNDEKPDLITTYNIASYLEANFSVNDLNISPKGYLQISYNGTIKNITSENDYFIVNGKNDKIVKLIFCDHEFGYRGALIYITVYYTNTTTTSELGTTLLSTTAFPKDEVSTIKSESSQKNYLNLFFVAFVFWITVFS
uniref:Uncharacterized protein n=1 Tax=Panagrolaimus sp. PS1159 TaxID=55785 RepID=A0AC35GIR2_9BILA